MKREYIYRKTGVTYRVGDFVMGLDVGVSNNIVPFACNKGIIKKFHIPSNGSEASAYVEYLEIRPNFDGKVGNHWYMFIKDLVHYTQTIIDSDYVEIFFINK